MTVTTDPLTLFGVNDRDTIELAAAVADRFADPGTIGVYVPGVDLGVELLVDKVGDRRHGLVGHAYWDRGDGVTGELWFGVAARIVWVTPSTAEGAFTRRFTGRGASAAIAADDAADELAETIARFAKGGAL